MCSYRAVARPDGDVWRVVVPALDDAAAHAETQTEVSEQAVALVSVWTGTPPASVQVSVDYDVAAIVDRFHYRVEHHEDTQQHVGIAAEWPGVTHEADDRPAALTGIRDRVADLTRRRLADGALLPLPHR